MSKLILAILLVVPAIPSIAQSEMQKTDSAGKTYLDVKVLVLDYDPIVAQEGGLRLHAVCGWSDPQTLAKGYMDDIRKASGGYVRYRVVDWRDIDEFPTKDDGFAYTSDTYMACHRGKAKWHDPDADNYHAKMVKFDIPKRVEAGEIDEVWMFGAPYFGWFESCMAGTSAYYINGTPLTDVKCAKVFAVMGFNYERGVGEMLEDLGHRTEAAMSHIYGGWEANKLDTPWARWAAYEKEAPGKAACGSVHYAPNSESDYDWGNKRIVTSSCDDWLNYPNLTGKTREVSSDEWGGGDIRKHHVWWFTHLPKAPGRTDGKLNNWWDYVIDMNAYEESRK